MAGLPPGQSGAPEFDPPLGKVPAFTFSHPVLAKASATWKENGGYKRLLEILR